MIPKLRKVPDSAIEFTGFAIAFDPIAGNLGDPDPYVATGSCAVRNVLLPASYSHIGAPAMEHLARQPSTRAWIVAWQPGATDAACRPTPTSATSSSPPTSGTRSAATGASKASAPSRCARRHEPEGPPRGRISLEARSAQGSPMTAMRGRLNLFQAAMLRWRASYPYNAVHVAELPGPLDEGRLSQAVDGYLTEAGIGKLALDGERRRYQYVRRAGPRGGSRFESERRHARDGRAGDGALPQRPLRR